jgi:hypothetical protein
MSCRFATTLYMKSINPDELKELANQVTWDNGEAGYALPQGSLALLMLCVRKFECRRVFEFGSGASTRVFLEAGCEVTSLENDQHWLGHTLKQVPETMRARHHAELRPLERTWCGGFPCFGWNLSETMRAQLGSADLVLVDSPAYPPFREAALMQALLESKARLVVLDDVRIPTLRRFCDRIAMQSHGINVTYIERDHTLAIFTRSGSSVLSNRPGFVEQIKGWRRYLMGRSAK